MEPTTLVIVTGLAFYMLTCLAFIDIAQKDFGSLAKKVAWGIVAFIPFIGCLIYFAIGFRRGKRPGRADHPVKKD